MKTAKILALTLAACLTLVSCSSAEVELSSETQTATPEASPLYTGDFKIPEDFPSVIPVRPGEVVVGTATGDEANRTWVVEVLIDDLDLVRTETLRDLEAAGFDLLQESGVGSETYRATFENPDYTLQLKIYLEEETGEQEILYLVNRK